MSTNFVHLNIHSEYSIVDSTVRQKLLLHKTLKNSIPAVGITDVNNFFGAIKLYREALKLGIKPIFGCQVSIQKENGQIVVLYFLAESNAGFQWLSELVSKAYLDAVRIDSVPIIPEIWILEKKVKDIIVLSGFQKGIITKEIANYDVKNATKILKQYKDIFGQDSVFIQLTRIAEYQQKNDEEEHILLACQIAEKTHTPVVACNEVRFINQNDFYAHEVKVGIFQGYNINDNSRKTIYTSQQYIKSPKEMQKLFSDIPQAISNTVIIAKRCNVTFELGKNYLPKFPIPDGFTESSFFQKKCADGLELRFERIFKNNKLKSQEEIIKKYKDRLEIEIKVISEMGFEGYFLIVADFIKWSLENNIPVGAGRGSGAGSLVAYSLFITDIDPLPYNLLFERFLNPERVSMPDFDIDFCIEGRDKVIQYVSNTYGQDAVSQIITYGTMSAKAVIRDVGRVLGYPYPVIERLSKKIPTDLGIKLKDAKELLDYTKIDDTASAVVETALILEGLVRNVGKHAAGVIIAPNKVTDFSPTYCEEGKRQIVSQFDKKDVEDVGLVKFDFLGLRNLTIIDNAVKSINKKLKRENKDIINISDIPLDDKKTFNLLSKGETTGIFQLESAGLKKLIRKMKPDCFEDIIALVALYRPGPLGSGMDVTFVERKHGKQRISYYHHLLEPILKETYGTILYQEQVMQISQILANYSLGSADILRRAMGKKDPKEMASQRNIFEKGAEDNGIDKGLATEIFDIMEKFAEYGFNKSHSAAYALISYQTAWLKTHYPSEFMASLLSADINNLDKIVISIAECKRMKIKIYPPNINYSDYLFKTKGNDIVYGLGSIKGVGEKIILDIVQNRKGFGEFKSLFDFAKRIGNKTINIRVLKSLTYCGAFDIFNKTRAVIEASLDLAFQEVQQITKDENTGQNDMFGFSSPNSNLDSLNDDNKYIEVSDFSFHKKLTLEQEVVGVCLSGHFIDEYQSWIKRLPFVDLENISICAKSESRLIVGIVNAVYKRFTKKGKVYALLVLSDKDTKIDINLNEEMYSDMADILKINSLVALRITATKKYDSEQINYSAMEFFNFNNLIAKFITSVNIVFDLSKMSIDINNEIMELFGKTGLLDSQELSVLEVKSRIKIINENDSVILNPIEIKISDWIYFENNIKKLNCFQTIKFVLNF